MVTLTREEAQRESEQVTQAMRLYKAVERLALQVGEEPDETVEWLCGERNGMFKLYEAYFSPEDTVTVQHEWQELADEEVVERANAEYDPTNFARGVAWATKKLKEKNT